MILVIPISVIFIAALFRFQGFADSASAFPFWLSCIGLALAMLAIGKGLTTRNTSPRQTERFEGLLPAAIFCAGILPIGLPAASALYAAAILIASKTHMIRVIIWSLALALSQLLLFSLVMDIRAEPLITGLFFIDFW